jgi:hypothetical protein
LNNEEEIRKKMKIDTIVDVCGEREREKSGSLTLLPKLV